MHLSLSLVTHLLLRSSLKTILNAKANNLGIELSDYNIKLKL